MRKPHKYARSLKSFASRRERIIKMYASGRNMQEIGKVFGISRARVHNIIYPDGVNPKVWQCPTCGTKRATPPKDYREGEASA